jgi:hypothetical protein
LDPGALLGAVEKQKFLSLAEDKTPTIQLLARLYIE